MLATGRRGKREVSHYDPNPFTTMAAAMIGSGSKAITLLFVPALYTLWDRLPLGAPAMPDRGTEAGAA